MNKRANNSDTIKTHTKESLRELCFEAVDSFRFLFRNKLASRFVAVLAITALLLPLVFVGNFNSVSAQGNLSSSSTAPISAPPIAYSFGSNTSSFSPVLAVSNTFSSFASYVSAPNLPEGFDIAQTSSPLYKDVSSSVASASNSLGSFFAFAVNSSTESNSSPMADGGFPGGATPFDFDGDNYADVSRWNPTSGEWKVKDNLGNLTTETLGSATSVIVPGDFDGDDKTDKAVWTNGTWTIRKSSGGADVTHSFGTTGDIPVTGDYDGDGKSDYAVFRPSTNTWWIQQSSNNAVTSTAYGATGDITVPGDYDGDNITDKAVYRPSTGVWYIVGSNSGSFNVQWGISTDTPIPADFNGDGKTDYGIYRPSTGTWYIYYTNGDPYTATVWGNYGDQPVAADYDGDGKADLSVWRPKTGVWLIKESDGGAYKYETLGMNGDVPVPAAYIKKVGGSVAEYDSVKLRLDPINSTGGTDLYSRNFSWGTGLVGLPGRSGLGAGFGISYNSLLWLKDDADDTISFDPDYSNVTPGFNMGFARIEPVYWDKNNGRFSYIMVTPSGARVEFQQIGATDTYETADSSYVQLKTVGASNPNDPVSNISITVTGTDGTMMEYEWKAGAFRAKEIKDTNGNYITISHDDYGLLKTVTDTLGRVITVNYDAELYPTTITQDWKTNNGSGSTTTHTYATFSYTNKTINTSFKSSLTVFGPPNGTVLKVLDKVTSASGAYTEFEYNDYGQVWKINNHAIDGHKLNHTSVNIGSPSVDQNDVPRFSETRSWVENFNLDTGGNEQETVYKNTFQENQSYTTPAGSGTGTLIEVSMVNHPHGNISKTYVGSTGWMESLPIVTEDWTDESNTSTRKRWSWTNWTQDDTNLTYIKNPRTIESKVGDDENNNIRRTTTDYLMQPNSTDITQYGLVERVQIFDTDQTTVLKKVETEYVDDSAYISRRIIGLPSLSLSYGMENSSLNLVSKMTYSYDEGDFSDSTLEQTITPIQHEAANYGASFIIGRGNLTSTTRHDVSGTTSPVTSSVRYNTAGSSVALIDAMNRTIKKSYTDSFNDGINNRNTYALATKLTDASGNFSEVKYRYDIGVNVWGKSPMPSGANNQQGKETTREFDAIGRLGKEETSNTGIYTKYEYPSNQNTMLVRRTLVDSGTNGVTQADETLIETYLDGAGRTIKSKYEKPNSTSSWIGVVSEYDVLGRVKRETIPTEIDSNWNPTGDDYRLNGQGNLTFLWKSKEFDWSNRTVKEIDTEGKDKIISYTGCGCAGGQVTTIQEELVPRDDTPNTFARRTQKSYSDILGRNFKTETLNWDGGVYLTTLTEFNGRDQALSITQTDASTSNSQITTRTYDGHSRLKTEHLPEMDSGTYREYEYQSDDQVSAKWDARGVKTNYQYNSIGQLSTVDYLAPQNSTLPTSPTITFGYDNLGNRLWMEDGMGRVDFEYDELSRMSAETRTFAVSLTDAPQSTNGFRFDYSYHLNGRLKKVTYPNGTVVDYNLDSSGMTESVTGTLDGQAETFISNLDHRAWGDLKSIDFGNGTKLERTFNDRLLPDTEKFTGQHMISGTTSETRVMVDNKYHYYDDGRIKLIEDNSFRNNQPYRYVDRLFEYDSMGKITKERSGREAIGTAQNGDFIKYKYDNSYDAFGNFKNQYTQTSYLHSAIPTSTKHYNYVNNRNMGGTVTLNGQWHGNISAWQYDADGRPIDNGTDLTSTYDEAGYISQRDSGTNYKQYSSQDGNGNLTKIKDVTTSTETINNQTITEIVTLTRYNLRSSLLKDVMVFETRLKQTYDDINQPPTDEETAINDYTFISGLGNNIATFKSSVAYGGDPTNPFKSLNFELDTSFRQNQIFTVSNDSPNNGIVGITYNTSQGASIHSFTPSSAGKSAGVRWDTSGFGGGDFTIYQNGECSLDGIFEFCNNVGKLMGFDGTGGAVQCPMNYCGPEVAIGNRGTVKLTTGFKAHADGSSGRYVETWNESDKVIHDTVEGEEGVEIIVAGELISQFIPSEDDFDIGVVDTTVSRQTSLRTRDDFPNCVSLYDFMNIPDVIKFIDFAWDASVKSGKEHGGWFFLGRTGNTAYARYATRGLENSMPDEPADFEAAYEKLKEEGIESIFFLDFHTHPDGVTYPNSKDGANLSNPAKKRASVDRFKPSRDMDWVAGIVVHGKGKYTYYTRSGVTLLAPDRTLKRMCLPYY